MEPLGEPGGELGEGRYLDGRSGGEVKVIREGCRERCSKRDERQKNPRTASDLLFYCLDNGNATPNKAAFSHHS